MRGFKRSTNDQNWHKRTFALASNHFHYYFINSKRNCTYAIFAINGLFC